MASWLKNIQGGLQVLFYLVYLCQFNAFIKHNTLIMELIIFLIQI